MLTVAGLAFLLLVQVWWSIAKTPKGPLTIGGFLPTLVLIVLLVLLAIAALPDEVPPSGEVDLHAYYHEQSPYIWTLLSVGFGWTFATEAAAQFWAKGALVAWFAVQVVELGFLAIMVSLIFVRRRWWHVVGLLVLSVGPIGWLSRSVG